MIRKTFS